MTPEFSSKVYAWQLYAMAVEFHQTYATLEEAKPRKHDFIAMDHYLLCHALELALKTLLVDTGNYNEKKLRNKFGHDLEKIANEVKKVYESFSQVDACMWHIQVLNPYYKTKGYEYPTKDGRFIGVDCVHFGKVVWDLICASIQSVQSSRYKDNPHYRQENK